MELEDKYGAHNYAPITVVFDRAEGCYVWDPEGKRYYDFLSAYSAVNQGHCHPRIVGALEAQARRCCLSSRAFYNNRLGSFERKLTSLLGFDKFLPMNTGAEAVETALKLARRWGYREKKIAPGEAIILAAADNFHGRTISIVSMSTDPSCRDDFGPFTPGLGAVCPHAAASSRERGEKGGKGGGDEGDAAPRVVSFGDIASLERALEAHGPRVAAFLVEPVQGEAGVHVPPDSYFPAVRALCDRHNVLLICDEIQSGLGRAGRTLAVSRWGVRPDLVVLGKALSGGCYPVSGVVADDRVMLGIGPGEHGSTYGGNPLACAVGEAALDVLVDERLSERSEALGERFRAEIAAAAPEYVKEVRGLGLMNAIEFDEGKTDRTCKQLCLLLKERGLLAKPTHGSIIRFSPPLTITDEQLTECIDIIKKALADLPTYDVSTLK